MKDFISSRVKSVEISGIRKFYNLVSKYPGAISLTIGQPDFGIPEEAEKGIIDSIKRGETKYTANSGIKPLRNQISNYLKSLDIDFKEEEIIVTVGGSEGLYSSMTAVINPGDYVLIPEIAYPAYENITKILGGKAVYYKLNEDFSVDIADLEEKISKYDPKLLILSFPSNPTGAVLSKDDRDSIYKIIKKNDLLVLSDEIYASLCFSDFYSVSQYSEIKDNIILVGGFSKMFSMTGLRLGFVAASECLINNILKVHQYNVSCAASIVQYGALEGLKNSSCFVENMKKEFIRRRDFVYNSSRDMGLDVIMPKGAFYIFPSIKKFKMSSFDFAFDLLDKKNLAVVPGSAFSEGGEGYIRISYASSMDDLKLGMERLREYINKK
ncbi:MAG: aminotransferase class I/II-fold pyridoxal phosphate-dependent enzyme [Clostridiaceae bacterium]